ncbi:TetR/AcrR family transcriptional regulator [Rhodococcus sp. BP-252]|uniref:TetR family transcriptional regulator n=1 Tax=Rhodococcoides kyotonense TaxID=398843 RepID=A0A177YG39_9NOCA|nr:MULTISPECIES: TetR/AcrR family transcriptional regulator [Rhodococcus]MBY6412721.1 TetR/AcrR family transcriptional regulator [Rhodococcus sp. BP-320]MBY6417481.1 TetR/AcrR family transcriptional regulator [Rhodococcus sp. BP-321]MBY6421741.1 TetR/AcrR family transcriptional regulator [Rhodococcus sp. BP-324]MBY6427480.1 TetR/AcrR family transcriptional regulator [Rhodococcus sp. BP-323]MBY6432669.1 TetR/AcrR family transcriptional regulator [Rhodococcus sp. BP-322]
MAQQERARRTRAAIVEAAASEFARRGYAAASVNTILEGSNATKGAMYFHFQSKEDLARAVLSAALDKYVAITERWRGSTLHPFDVLHGIIDDLARSFQSDVIVRAEFRLIVEPEFYSEVQSGGGKVWGLAGLEQARRAQELGDLSDEFTPEKFVRVLSASLAGQRYMADLVSDSRDLRAMFEESLEVILFAMATPQWLDAWRTRGWSENTVSSAENASDLPV